MNDDNINPNVDEELRRQNDFLQEYVNKLEVQQFLDRFVGSHKYNRPLDNMDEYDKNVTTIVTVGKTRAGKSSTCSSLSGIKEIFPSKMGQRSFTQCTQVERVLFKLPQQEEEIILRVIDTPGYFDLVPYEEERRQNLDAEIRAMQNAGDYGQIYQDKVKERDDLIKTQKKMRLKKVENDILTSVESSGLSGISAFFVVVSSIEAIGADHVEMFNGLTKLFDGQHFRPRAFLVITHLDEIQMSEKDFIDKELHTEVKLFLKGIDNRYIFVDNKLIENEDASEQLLMWRNSCISKVVDNVTKNKLKPYNVWYGKVPKLRPQLELVKEKMEKAIEERKMLRDNINDLWTNYSKHRKNTLIARGVSAGSSLGVGLPLTTAGLVLAVPTFGVSTILIIAGSTISILGGLTAAGASSVNYFKKHNAKKEVDDYVAEFTGAMMDLHEAYEKVEKEFVAILRNFCSSVVEEKQSSVLTKSEISFIAATNYFQALLSGGRAAFQVTCNLSDDFLKLIGVVGMRAVPIIGVVIGSLLDLTNLATTLHSAINFDQSYNENVQSKLDKCDKDFSALQQRVADLQATITKFCEDPVGFVDHLMETVKTYYTCFVCEKFLPDDIQHCLIGIKHNSGCRSCLKKFHDDQIEKNKEPTCPVCMQIWPNIVD